MEEEKIKLGYKDALSSCCVQKSSAFHAVATHRLMNYWT